jgi:salicylate hydroxylase
MSAWSRYEHLDEQGKKMQESKAKNPDQSFEEGLQARVNALGGGVDKLSWIYQSDIEEVWEEFVKSESIVNGND